MLFADKGLSKEAYIELDSAEGVKQGVNGGHVSHREGKRLSRRAAVPLIPPGRTEEVDDLPALDHGSGIVE